jgi:hypothetical protein
MRPNVFMAAIILLISGCARVSAAQAPTSPAKSSGHVTAKSSQVSRETRFNEMIEDLTKYCRSSDKKVSAICKLGLRTAVLAEPVPAGLRVMKKTTFKATPLFVVPLLPEDANVAPMWRDAVKAEGWSAMYDSVVGALYLKPDQISRNWRFGLICHEIEHERQKLEGEIPKQVDRRAMIVGEMKAHSLNNQVLLILGGRSYSQWLNRRVTKLQAWYGAENSSPLNTRPPDSYLAYDKQLDKIFGKPLSDRERYNRASTTYVHTMFEVAKKMFRNKSDVLNAQASVMHNLYKDIGHGPSK